MGSIFAGKQIEKKLYEKIIGQWSNINLYQNNLEQIINGQSYKKHFADALKNKPHPMCIELCNKKSGKLYNKHLDNV